MENEILEIIKCPQLEESGNWFLDNNKRLKETDFTNLICFGFNFLNLNYSEERKQLVKSIIKEK